MFPGNVQDGINEGVKEMPKPQTTNGFVLIYANLCPIIEDIQSRSFFWVLRKMYDVTISSGIPCEIPWLPNYDDLQYYLSAILDFKWLEGCQGFKTMLVEFLSVENMDIDTNINALS